MEEPEIWKPIPDYAYYMVSSWGRIKSLDKIVRNNVCKFLRKGQILKPSKDKFGYFTVNIRDADGKKKSLKIHRLVLLSFTENSNNLPEVNHKDNIKANNALGNLEWCDRSYNCKHKYRFCSQSSQNKQSKPVKIRNTKSNEIFVFPSTARAASHFKISASIITKCATKSSLFRKEYVAEFL